MSELGRLLRRQPIIRAGDIMVGIERATTRRLGAVLGLALAAWLSAGAGGDMVNPQAPPSGQSDAFKDGYVDGCRTGFQDAGRDGFQLAGRKDDARYITMADYKAGYDQAYHACFEEQKRNPRMMGEPGGAGGRN